MTGYPISGTLIIIGLSVLMHVAWNLLARHVEARCNYLWWGLLIHLVLLGPWAIWHLVFDAHWNNTLLLAMLISALANTVYFIALRKAYHFAPVTLVYPIARSSPVLIAAWAWLVFDQPIAISGVIGITISVVGLWLLAATSKKGDTAHALPWALFAAFSTSIYSISDKVAVDYLPGFGAQLGFITIGYAASFVGLTLVQYKESKRFCPQCRPKLPYLLIGGLFIGVAYALVVRAMLELPAAYVVTYTNAGIVIATILSILMFKDKEHWKQRLVAVLIVCIGMIILGVYR